MNTNNTIRSACRMCHGSCQVKVHMEDDRVQKITADANGGFSQGSICPKGLASPELLYHPDRILHPLRRRGEKGENKWEQITWEEALNEMATKLQTVKDDFGPEYFAMIHGTTRPYVDFANRFANAFGTPNFSHVGHICYVPRIMAGIYSIGSQQLPVVDFQGFGGISPKCIVLWGSNTPNIGSAHGVTGSVAKKAIHAADKVIVIDPRRTASAEKADQWMQIRPGTDGALALAMMNVIINEKLYDKQFVDNHTLGFKELKSHVQPYTPAWAESITRIDRADIFRAARDYASISPAGILWGSAIDQSVSSFQTARSLLILSAITGNLDIPGGNIMTVGPDQINFKSQIVNREISGILHLPFEKLLRIVDRNSFSKNGGTLKGKLGLKIIQAVDRFKERKYEWLAQKSAQGKVGKQLHLMYRLKKPKYPLLPMVHQPTLWESIESENPYRIKSLWILGSNPLATQSNPQLIEKALRKIEYLVVSDFFLTPTAQYADLILPPTTWLEQDDVVNALEHWCVLARRKVTNVGETMDDREVMLKLAHKLGLGKAFPWKSYRQFIDWMLERSGMTFEQFAEQGGMISGKMEYEKYKKDGFGTPSGKFEIYSKTLEKMGVAPLPVYRENPDTHISKPDFSGEYPLILTSGARSIRFFHSEGRQLPSLRRKNPNPLVEIHPETAASMGVEDGNEVWIENQHGRIKMAARLFDGIAKDVVHAQHGWWFPEKSPPEYGWKESNVNLLLGSSEFDPDIGSESLRSNICKIYPV